MSRQGLFPPLHELLPAWAPGTAQPFSAPPIPFSEADEPATPAKHAGCCSSGSQAGVRGGMWPRVLLGEARVAAGGCRALSSRLAVRFSPPWTAGNGLTLRRSLHGTATRPFPLIPIVVEQTVRGRDGDMAQRLVVGRRARNADLSPLLFPRRVEASALMTYTRDC